MARYNPIKNSFVAGLLSRRMEGRDDLDQYAQGMRQAQNGIVTPHGGFMRRGGSRFVAETKIMTKKTFFLPFQFSVIQAYMVEFGDLYARFYTNEGQLDSGGPVEVVTPYLDTEVAELQIIQSADVAWVIHPNHPPYNLKRTSATAFTFTKVVFKDGKGPLRPDNLDVDNKLTVTGAGPTGHTLTWVQDTLDADTTFDVGRVVRVNDGTNQAWYLITSVTDQKIATADRVTGAASGADKDDWALGLFSDKEGARGLTFHEGRLGYGGSKVAPDWYVLSVSDDFDNFDVRDPAKTDAENADKSIARRLVAKDVNAVQWMASADEQLVIGGASTEFRVFGASNDIITPLSIQTRGTTNRGSVHVQPVVIDSDIYYVQRNSRKVRKYAFNLDQDSYRSREDSILAEDVFDAGIIQVAYQQDPDSVIWCVMNDGALIGMTVEKDQKVIAAHIHIYGDPTLDAIETAGVIPNPSGKEDQLWIIAKRTIGGVTKRYVEFIEETYRVADKGRVPTDAELVAALDQAFYVDSGLTLDIPFTVTAATKADPVVVTTDVAHGFSNGDRVKHREIGGMVELNLNSYKVASVTATTYALQSIAGVNIDGTGFTTYTSGGKVRKETQTVTGLAHLNGRVVQLLVDGGVHPDKTVAAGSVSLDSARFGSIIHVGLGNDYFGETQRFVGGGRIGTDQGRKQKIRRVVLRLLWSIGGKVGVGENPSGAKLEPLIFDQGADLMDQSPVPTIVEDRAVPVDGGWEVDPTVFFLQDQPLPMHVLCVMPENVTSER